ncbi:Uncharacterised protein [Salmonella enterica subsp. enterica]|nr:Uncharacterised protein [Salmonella enterica subsp. enterica]
MTFRDGVQLSFPLFDDRLRGAHFTLALLQQGTGGGNRAFGLFNLRNRLQPLLLQHAGIHFRQHLALTNELPFRNEDGINTPGNLSGNIHFGGFNSAVAGGKPLRYSRRAQHPPGYRGHRHKNPRSPPHQMTLHFVHNRPAVIPVV